jgi:hypothetical protein
VRLVVCFDDHAIVPDLQGGKQPHTQKHFYRFSDGEKFLETVQESSVQPGMDLVFHAHRCNLPVNRKRPNLKLRGRG